MRVRDIAVTLCILVTVPYMASGVAMGVTAGVKLAVNEEGIYAVTGAMLENAGVALEQLKPADLGISCAGRPVARRVLGAEAGITADTRIIFYGQPLVNRWTETNSYRLSWDASAVLDMEKLQLAEKPAPELLTFKDTLRLEENKQYGYLIWIPQPGELDPWFWETIEPRRNATIAFDIPHLIPDAGDGQLRIYLRGRTSNTLVEPDHHVNVEFNGTPVADVHFDGQAACIIDTALPGNSLKLEHNELVIKCPADTKSRDLDKVFLDRIEVDYARGFSYVARGLKLQLPEGAAGFTITDITGAGIDLYDLSDPAKPAAAAGLPVKDGAARIALPSRPHRQLMAVTETAYLTPPEVLFSKPSNLLTEQLPTSGADYIIIAHDDLVEAVAPLAEYRSGQQLRVATVPLSAIYDHFGHGVISPHAIREFVRHAYDQWQPPAPQYLLLVGDANYDANNYLGHDVPNLLPAYPVRIQDGVETPSDFWYACVAGDDQVPEMAVGRLPASNPAQLTKMIDKTIRYERQDTAEDWAKRILVIADHELQSDDPGPFEVSIERFWKYLQLFGYDLEAHYLRVTGISRNKSSTENRERVRTTATPAILDAWNKGVAMVAFEGHGGALYWSREKVFTSDDVAKLTNEILPVCVDITCFAGQFDRPDLPGAQCLAEVLLTSPGGAAACITPTRLGGVGIHHEMARRIALQEAARLGPLLVATRQRYFSPGGDFWGRTSTYNLLGDPALELKLARSKPPPKPATAETPAAGKPAAEPGPASPRQPPDDNDNRIDDRLEQKVEQLRAADKLDTMLTAAILLNKDCSLQEVAVEVEKVRGKVKAQDRKHGALLVSLPAGAVLPLAETLGEKLQFMRYGK